MATGKICDCCSYRAEIKCKLCNAELCDDCANEHACLEQWKNKHYEEI